MITVISGTNKKNSLTRQVAAIYTKQLQVAGNEVKQLLLEELDYSFISADMFSLRPEYITRLQVEYFNSASKFVFVVPEYNGSFPGILKVLLDTFDVKPAFENKKAALVGVATGSPRFYFTAYACNRNSRPCTNFQSQRRAGHDRQPDSRKYNQNSRETYPENQRGLT